MIAYGSNKRKEAQRDGRKRDSESAEQHVSPNAFLPGMYHDGGVRPYAHAPQEDAALPAVIHLSVARELSRISPRFFVARNGDRPRKIMRKKE